MAGVLGGVFGCGVCSNVLVCRETLHAQFRRRRGAAFRNREDFVRTSSSVNPRLLIFNLETVVAMAANFAPVVAGNDGIPVSKKCHRRVGEDCLPAQCTATPDCELPWDRGRELRVELR